MARIDLEKLRGAAQSLPKFLIFEREVEEDIRREDFDRRQIYDEKKQAREKRARKKRIKQMRSDRT